MQLTVQQIEQFQALYRDHFGCEISDDSAREQGLRLIHLIGRVHRPITSEEHKRARKYENYYAKKPKTSIDR